MQRPPISELLPLSAEVERISDDIYGYRRRLEFFLDQIEARWPGRGVRILDVGCGTGKYVTIPLARAGHEVLGVDFDAKSLELGRKLAHDVPRARFLEVDLAGYTPDAPFDVIVASEVLEHLREPAGLLRTLTPLLARDGLLLITVPNGWGLKERDVLVQQWMSRVLPLSAIKAAARGVVDGVMRRGRPSLANQTAETTLNANDPHVQWFSVGSMSRLLATNGFRVIRGDRRCFSQARR